MNDKTGDKIVIALEKIENQLRKLNNNLEGDA